MTRPSPAASAGGQCCSGDDAVKDLVAKVSSQGKIVGLICHAGLVGISAGIVDGRRATGIEAWRSG